MSYIRSTKLNVAFADNFAHLKTAFAERNAKLDSPSVDGYLLRLSLGKRRPIYFNEDALPLNSASARSLAQDKLSTYQTLSANGIAVPEGIAFFSSAFRQEETRVEPRLLLRHLPKAILQYFPNIGDSDFKVIIKPGQGSRGYMVNICTTLFEIMLCAQNILTQFRYGLIQKYVDGPEYRVVILDGQAILAYKKKESPHEKFKQAANRGNRLSAAVASNPVRGNTGSLVPIAEVPAEVITIARNSSSILGLRYSGVDVCLPREVSPAIVIEINTNPGFDALKKNEYDPKIIAGKLASAVLKSYDEINKARSTSL